MGNLCGPRRHDTIIASFSDPIMPMIKEQDGEESNDQANIHVQTGQVKQQPQQHEISTIKSLISSHISSLPDISSSSQVQTMQKATIIPPSQIRYDKLEKLQLLSQVPSDFFNQCSMSKYFVPTNSKVQSFNSSKTQSKIQEGSRHGNSPTINFYLKPITSNEFNNVRSEVNQRHSRSELKETTSTEGSNEGVNLRKRVLHNTVI